MRERMRGPCVLYGCLLVAVWCLVIRTASADLELDNPGLKIRFTRAGLNYGAQTTLNVLSKQVRGMTIPDESGSASAPVIGHVDYSVSGMTLTSFQTPTSTVTTQPFGWTVRNIRAGLHGKWHYSKKKGWVHISDSGTFDVSISGWAISVTVDIGVSSTRRPTVRTASCNCYTGSTSVKFHGGASWLYNLFSNSIEKTLAKQLSSQFCAQVTKMINVKGNAELQTMKVTVPLGKSKVELDYGLTQAPSFTVDTMETYHKGEVYWTADKKEAPFSPPPLPEVSSNKMVTFWVSQYVINTLGYVDYKHNAIAFNLTKDDLPPAERQSLNTSCEQLTCIGFYVTDLEKYFPDSWLEINMAVSKAPSMQITKEKGLSGSFEGTLEFYARKASDQPAKFAFSVKTSVALALNISIQGMKIMGEVDNFTVGDTTLISSKIGDKFIKKFSMVMSTLMTTFVKQKLNELMGQGLELPKLDDFQFVKPEIELVQNAVIVSTDLKYTG